MVGLAVVLALLAAAAVPVWRRSLVPHAVVRDGVALGLLGLLGLAAVLALAAGPVEPDATWRRALVVALAGAAAVAGGGPVTEAVLRRASRGERPAIDSEDGDVPVLRGGAWIGALERVAVFAGVVALSPEAVAVVLAVKGLGRYAELKTPGAAERFIIGTLASLIWAAAAAGVALLVV